MGVNGNGIAERDLGRISAWQSVSSFPTDADHFRADRIHLSVDDPNEERRQRLPEDSKRRDAREQYRACVETCLSSIKDAPKFENTPAYLSYTLPMSEDAQDFDPSSHPHRRGMCQFARRASHILVLMSSLCHQ